MSKHYWQDSNTSWHHSKGFALKWPSSYLQDQRPLFQTKHSSCLHRSSDIHKRLQHELTPYQTPKLCSLIKNCHHLLSFVSQLSILSCLNTFQTWKLRLFTRGRRINQLMKKGHFRFLHREIGQEWSQCRLRQGHETIWGLLIYKKRRLKEVRGLR